MENFNLEQNVYKGRTAGDLHQYLDDSDYSSAVGGLGEWLSDGARTESVENVGATDKE